jgi:5-(carboxyamino)imidazole ribonucleotide synthase
MKKLGILGGGQLGKMLCLAAADWDLETYILDTEGCSAQNYCAHFVVGDYKNYDDVVQFGRQVDVLTIEIEHVNVEALRTLQKEGITVHPNPDSLDLIKDKGLQKRFYQQHKIKTAKAQFCESKEEVLDYLQKVQPFPCVWKSRKGGYDGKGVAILKTLQDAEKLPDTPCLIEEKIDFEGEIAVMVARNEQGQVVCYPAVWMFFDPELNLLDVQMCPAPISDKLLTKAIRYAKKIIEELNICGVLAVEMFVKGDDVWVNEVAPRPHNSGHHTIEGCITSQFHQHLRGVLNLPLGVTLITKPSMLINLLGEKGYEGKPIYEGFEKALATEGVYLHLYGKTTTKPARKMGHVTILHRKIEEARKIAWDLKETLKVVSR